MVNCPATIAALASVRLLEYPVGAGSTRQKAEGMTRFMDCLVMPRRSREWRARWIHALAIAALMQLGAASAWAQPWVKTVSLNMACLGCPKQ